MSSWIAAATAYSTTGVNMVPFYIYYSMFGFQRIGDLAWAAGDMQARGFLIGGTAGRTTLAGEGLQHQDGHSLLQATLIPNCIAYDPTFSYEMARYHSTWLKTDVLPSEKCLLLHNGPMNENYAHPAMPEGVEEGIIKGIYRFKKNTHNRRKLQVNLMGSGAIFREVIAAAELLDKDFDISTNIWGVTSFNELRRDAMDCERWNMLHPEDKPRVPYITQMLGKETAPFVAATDYICNYPDQIRAWIPARYTLLGTDGFGRSDTREALRHYFEVDRYYIVGCCTQHISQQRQHNSQQSLKGNPEIPAGR